MSQFGFTKNQTMQLLGRKFRYDPFLYIFGRLNVGEMTNKDTRFQLIVELDGIDYAIEASPLDHLSEIIDKIVSIVKIPRCFVHLGHNGLPINLSNPDATISSLELQQEDVLHIQLYLGKAGMLKRHLTQSQETDRYFMH